MSTQAQSHAPTFRHRTTQATAIAVLVLGGAVARCLAGDDGDPTRPPPWPMCGAPGAGSCFTLHPGHGCDDKACCEAVCALDPSCCESIWDASCATSAVDICNGSYLCGEGGDCFVPAENPSCLDPGCCGAVCEADAWCCIASWDDACVVVASGFCDPCPIPSPTDLTCDGMVDAADLALLLGSWDTPGAGDIDFNGTTDGADLAALLGAWGPVDPIGETELCTATLTWVSWELAEGHVGTDSWNASVHGRINSSAGSAGGGIHFLSSDGALGLQSAVVGEVVTVDIALASVTVPKGTKLIAKCDGKSWERDIHPAGPGGTAIVEKSYSPIGYAKETAICDGSGGSLTFTLEVIVKDPVPEPVPAPGENPHDGEAVVRFTYLLTW